VTATSNFVTIFETVTDIAIPLTARHFVIVFATNLTWTVPELTQVSTV